MVLGLERYRSLGPIYYRGAKAALVIYDATDAKSFDIAKSWVEELHTAADYIHLFALVANKMDLDGKEVSPMVMISLTGKII